MSQQQPQSQSQATDAAHSPPGSRTTWASAETRPGSGPGAAPGTGPGGFQPSPSGYDWATGGLVFAGVLMLVNGLLAILQGISAIAEDDVYGRIGDYVFKINLTAWGWILLGLGVVAVCVGYGILKGAWWARITGIFLASLSLVAHFLFLPYTPVWSVITVGIDFFVILALATAPDVSGAHANAASASTRGNASAGR
ncbi:membrane protein [Streptomyces viridochromogenes]|uniref:Membrane protein n=1 Tax=Streptomyces viridochromogenes TaxID=1938 RepID=A0A0J8BTL5_STRVR|nr:membrane protein [Streptomyces viridochromogenes]KMS68910.1 membrane protein [Streptomyces viridochromogenes]